MIIEFCDLATSGRVGVYVGVGLGLTRVSRSSPLQYEDATHILTRIAGIF